MYFSFQKMQVTIVTFFSDQYCRCYKLYQIIQTTHSFLFSALYMFQKVLLVLSFMPHNSILFSFMLTKDGVNIYDMYDIVYTCVWVKSQKLCHNCPAIYLFSWEGEGNPYVSNPVNSSKCTF